jgi:hypothetical protein
MASDNAPEGSGVSARYKERYKKTPSVFVEHDVGAYKRILIHDNQQPCKYMKQPKARHRSYRLKSAMDAGLDSNLESYQESEIIMMLRQTYICQRTVLQSMQVQRNIVLHLSLWK